jgi:single-stranded-DNA-specific exonuclease
VIVIDHHEIIEGKVPATPYIIDPKQKDDISSFKLMAACGLCFKVAQALLAEKMSFEMKKSFLELVAIGTIADMMPETDENKIFIQEGLGFLFGSLRPGLLALKEVLGSTLSNREFAQRIVSALQITDSNRKNLVASYLLFSQGDLGKARKLAKKIIKQSQARHKIMFDVVEEVGKKADLTLPFVFFTAKIGDMPGSLVGGVASRVCNNFNKPAFIIACQDGFCRGSARANKPVNLVDALNVCSALLNTYGGHPQAAGFSLSEESLEQFRGSLGKYFSKATNL